MTSPPRALRRDAAHNRERLLEAARRLFAQHGPDTPLEEVAAAAEVSRTTLYRHFASREELAAVVFEENVAAIERRAAELAGAHDAIMTLVGFMLDVQRDNRSMSRLLSTADRRWFSDLSERTAAAIQPLLDHGRAHGVVHDDVGMTDLLLVFPMAEGGLADSDAAGRDHADVAVRALVFRALFTERALAAAQSR